MEKFVKPDEIVIVTQPRSVQVEGRDVGEENVQVVLEVVDLIKILLNIKLTWKQVELVNLNVTWEMLKKYLPNVDLTSSRMEESASDTLDKKSEMVKIKKKYTLNRFKS